ncbi:NADH-dependent flavin oxidoreductase [Ureibacillus acetophenoni]|uniref:2,4-dienoyl-CoA reductase-like NADH-dependent reductase (Old Yellow Enzyme family) n=1 Tax=Ureibacillus acetophenoni TaxID=614649 RepID=A0A285U9E7_9BACL|nr:NADH-dependent flavin oxidoreductase [Ureibacillus acetophenoni]SOC38363.1 2,4-dienoyl-CoA reductase-like NADH-dependent reductase (Old Yellow Enzyme family) [Ureibacillus acetophenoni]
MNEKYKDLFSPLTLPNGVELKNRLVIAPMTHYSSNPDGTVTEDELRYYARRSGGVSAVITACTYVIQNGKGFFYHFGADRDELIPSLRKVATAIKEQGAKAILQIYHGGRQSPPDLVPNGDIVSASAIPAERPGAKTPRALTETEIEEIIDAFGEATRRAIEAGYDGVEVHGANGYLVQQFFSPHSNRREDRFGGSLERRMAFPLAIIDKINSVVAAHAKSPFIVGYRFSPEEAETPGITMVDTLKFVDVLADQGLDYLHVSLGDFFSTPRVGVDDLTKTRVEYLLETIDNRVPLIGVGSIQTADDARKALDTGVALLAIGRGIIVDPDWVQKIQEGRENEIITKINRNNQKELVIPDGLWHKIMNVPGWFPVE